MSTAPSTVDELFTKHTALVPCDDRAELAAVDAADEAVELAAVSSALRTEATELASIGWHKWSNPGAGVVLAVMATTFLALRVEHHGLDSSWLPAALVTAAITTVCFGLRAFMSRQRRTELVRGLEKALADLHDQGGYELVSAVRSATESIRPSAERLTHPGHWEATIATTEVGPAEFQLAHTSPTLIALQAFAQVSRVLGPEHAMTVALNSNILNCCDAQRLVAALAVMPRAPHTPVDSTIPRGHESVERTEQSQAAFTEALSRAMSDRLEEHTMIAIFHELGQQHAKQPPFGTPSRLRTTTSKARLVSHAQEHNTLAARHERLRERGEWRQRFDAPPNSWTGGFR